MCGGSILSCCPRNPHGHERALKEEEDELLLHCVLDNIKWRGGGKMENFCHVSLVTFFGDKILMTLLKCCHN